MPLTRSPRQAQRPHLGAIPALLGFGLLSASCSEVSDPVPAPVPTTVEISAPVAVLRAIGETTTLSTRVLNQQGEPLPRAITLSSSDPSVVSVTSTGVVTAVGNGTAFIEGRVDDVTGTLSISVDQEIVALTLSGADTVFNPGVRTRLVARAVDALGNQAVEPLRWLSDAPAVVSVDDGLALPETEGTARVTVQAGDMETSHEITVVDAIPLEVPSDLAETFQWAFEDSSASNGVFGGQAAILIPGVGLWKGVLGRSDAVEVMRPDMMFYPGSIKKTFSAAVLLTLVRDGIVTLQDSPGQWVEPFENPNIPMGITIQQMLQNTSGIYSYASHPTLGDSLFADPDRVWLPRELMEKFMLAPEFEPGTSWKSSNSGYVLSGILAEAATGETMPSLLRNRILDPLGMRESAVLFFEEPTSPVAATWRGTPGNLVSSADLQTTAGHTILWPQTVLSAEALLRFAQGLFGELLDPATRAAMLTAVPDDGKIPGQVGAGIGIREYNYLGRTQWGHSGSQGAGSGFVVWDEASGVIVSVLYNQNGSSHRSSHFWLVPELLRLALDAM